jgi:hypothetical protein
MAHGVNNIKRHDDVISRFLGAFTKFRKASSSPHVRLPSVYSSAWNNSAPTGQSLMKLDI